jgi:kumamolisin
VSSLFSRPSFQTGCGVPAGSTRLVPDVALEADGSPGNYVAEGGGWWIVGGTSGAAPQWAAYIAKLVQLGASEGIGNPGAYLYALCGTAYLHDITSGTNGDYSAGAGYDMVTGLGSIDARNFFGVLDSGSAVPALAPAGAAGLLGLLAAAGAGLARRGGRSSARPPRSRAASRANSASMTATRAR